MGGGFEVEKMKPPVACPACGRRLRAYSILPEESVARWEGLGKVDKVLVCFQCGFLFPVCADVPYISEDRYMVVEGVSFESNPEGQFPGLVVVSPEDNSRYFLKFSGFLRTLWERFNLEFGRLLKRKSTGEGGL